MTLARAASRTGGRALCAGCCIAVFSAAGMAQRPAASVSLAPRIAPAGIARIGPLTVLPRFQASSVADRGRPPVEPARVAGEMLAGAYAGLAGYLVGSWVGDLTSEVFDAASEGTKDQIRFGMGVIAGGMATAASVSAIGNIGDQTGSYPAALAGTAGGVVAGLILNQLLYGHARLPNEGESSRMRWIEASLEAMLPSIGATIAFTSSRRYK